VPFQIGFQRRWDKRYQQAKSLIEEGAIGQPVLLKAYGRDPNVSDRSKWGLDHNGGIFLNCAIHDYDTARWLLGEEPIKLQATADVLVHRDLYEVGDADHCATRLEFMDSAVALTEWSRFATYGYDIGLEVVGTDGAIKLNLTSNRPGLTLRRATSRTTSVFDVFCCAFEDSIKGFVAAVESGSETTPGIQDALASLRIALAARDSAHYDGEDVFL
jgi:predicted dehydrogenase